MRKFDVYDYIFWICETILGLWILAKFLGWIHTPFIVEMLPLLMLFFMGETFYQKMIMKINHLEKDLERISSSLDARITRLEAK